MSQVHYTTPHAQSAGNGLAVASLVLGIVGLVLAFIPIIGVVAWILGPLAIIFGFAGRSRAKRGAPNGGMAMAGLIMGIITVAIAIVWVIAFASEVSKTT
jgi:lysylphosphatidylglycerol synthetase-like protein (DUF2156 family)